MDDPNIYDAGDFFVDLKLEKMFMPVREITDELLTESIREHGIKQPLEVWDEGNLLIDGHRRFRISRKLKVPFEVRRLSFPDRDAAVIYMRTEQFARRNCSDHERAIETSRLYQSLKGTTSRDAAEVVANITNQSTRSVHRKNRYAQAFDQLSPGWQAFIKECKVPQKYVTEIVKCTPAVQQSLLDVCIQAGHWECLKSRFGAIYSSPELSGITLTEQMSADVAKLDKKARTKKLLKDAERAGGGFHRSIGRLFGEEGLDAMGSYWKRRIDKAYREIGTVLQEVGDEL